MRRQNLRATFFVAASVLAINAFAAEYFVSPTGLDTNSGSEVSPFATFQKAINLALPGDTIYGRDGVYNFTNSLSISSGRSGASGNPISLLAYPGETPILDFRGQSFSSTNGGQRGLSLSASYWHIRGFTVQYAADSGVIVSGSNNILEQMVSRQNQDSGFQINGGSSFPSNNLFLNCDSYGNFDFGTGSSGDHRAGEDADGFALKERGLGPGNIISGARAWNNGDDGFDFWEAQSGVTVVNSWSFNNGIASTFNLSPSGYAGDGNGIKLGHDSGTHVLQNMLVFGNPAMGVDINGNATQLEGGTPAVIPHGVQVLNVTAAMNGARNINFDENPTMASPPTQHILRNNISFSGSTRVDPGNTADHNTFNGPSGSPPGLGVTAADFVSTVNPVISNGSYHPAGTGGDRSGVTIPVHATGPAVAPRLADGSLPYIDFMRLAPGSDLIDAGIDVGLPFAGLAPDLGAFETGLDIEYAPGDFDENGFVDANDLDNWQEGYGLLTGATHANGDADEDGDVDGSDFLIWQRGYSAGMGGQTDSLSVPEPCSVSLLILMAAACGASRRTS